MQGGRYHQDESNRSEIIQLPLVDRRGRAVPGAFGRGSHECSSAQQSEGGRILHTDGTKKRHSDAETCDLKTLVKQVRCLEFGLFYYHNSHRNHRSIR